MTVADLIRRYSSLMVVGLLAFLPGPARGQQPSAEPLIIEIPGEPDDLVDRVVAVAGDSVILLSQVETEMILLAAQGAQFPSDPQGLRSAAAEVLESMINVQLLLQEAARDTTLSLDPELITGRVQAQVDAVQAQLGGLEQVQAAVEADGMTMAEYRETLRARIERDLMQQLFLQRQLQNAPSVALEDAEMRELYEAQRASLQQRPEILSLEQLVIPVLPPDSMWVKAKAEIDSLARRIAAGEDFAEVAMEASDDPGTQVNGGDLGWFRRGAMVPEFDAVAFSLPDNQVSAPFRSSYGWHIMRVDRQRPGEVKARHIIVRPESGPDDLSSTIEKARGIASRLEAGESMNALATEFGHDDRIPVQLPRVSRDALDQLPEGYAAALVDVTEGEILPPFQVMLQGPFVAVMRVKEVREAGEFTFEDVRDQIRDRLSEQKNLARIWQRLRENAYVDVRF
jgi:peptidyl-prolyl cis-trans isomerase SurA